MTSNSLQPNQQASQQANLDINQLSKDLKDAMSEVEEIQSLIIQFIDAIIIRKNDAVEKETLAIKATLQKVHAVKSELDKIAARYSKLRLIQIHPVPLGNAGYITLDPTEDRNDFYQKLIESYTWLDNLNQDASKLSDLMKNNYLSSKPVSKTSKLADIYEVLKEKYKAASFSDEYLLNYCCMKIKVGQAFVVYVFFSGIELSFVKVKSVNEAIELDLTGDTRHIVFQKMTDHFIAMILQLTSSDNLNSANELVDYILSYENMFKTKCKHCGKYLSVDSSSKTLLPPLMKINKSFIHFSCSSL